MRRLTLFAGAAFLLSACDDPPSPAITSDQLNQHVQNAMNEMEPERAAASDAAANTAGDIFGKKPSSQTR